MTDLDSRVAELAQRHLPLAAAILREAIRTPADHVDRKPDEGGGDVRSRHGMPCGDPEPDEEDATQRDREKREERLRARPHQNATPTASHRKRTRGAPR